MVLRDKALQILKITVIRSDKTKCRVVEVADGLYG